MREEITDLLALKLWWAFTWRALSMAIISGIAVGIVIGLIAGVAGSSPEEMQGPSMIAGGFMGIFVSVKVFKYLMTRGFGQYKLVVVSNDAG